MNESDERGLKVDRQDDCRVVKLENHPDGTTTITLSDGRKQYVALNGNIYTEIRKE